MDKDISEEEWDEILGDPKTVRIESKFTFYDYMEKCDFIAEISKIKKYMEEHEDAHFDIYMEDCDCRIKFFHSRPETREEQKERCRKMAEALEENRLREEQSKKREYEIYLLLKQKYEGGEKE